MKDNRLTKTGPFITTTFSVELVDAKQIMDREFLIPVDKHIEKNGLYTSKPIFCFANAVFCQHIGNPEKIMVTYNSMLAFMKEQNDLERQSEFLSSLYNA